MGKPSHSSRSCSALESAAIATVAQEQNRMVVNQQHLKGVWNTDGIAAANDWKAWLKRLGLELMRQSPSHALRSCHGLAEVHSPFGQELFNVAFISCWTELYEQYRVSTRGSFRLWNRLSPLFLSLSAGGSGKAH